jgi:hypothetical protein
MIIQGRKNDMAKEKDIPSGSKDTSVDLLPREDVAPSPTPMGPWGPEGIRAPQIPNLYQLRGDHLHITYSPSGFDGRKYFTYHDAKQMLNFRGDAVRIANAEFGTLVSVTLASNARNQSTEFTLVVPVVKLFASTQAQVKTFGITTIQEIGIDQTQLYTVTELSGTASIVQF